MSWSGLVGEADPFEPVVSYPRPVERAPRVLARSTAWDFTDLEGGSAAVSAALDSSGGERL